MSFNDVILAAFLTSVYEFGVFLQGGYEHLLHSCLVPANINLMTASLDTNMSGRLLSLLVKQSAC